VATGVGSPAAPKDAAAASQYLMQLAAGYIVSTALHLATELRVADHLKDGPRSAAYLAEAVGVLEDPLYRVLRLLSSVGVFEEVSPRVFAANTAASLLATGAPGRVYDMVRWMAGPFHLRVYAEAMHSMRTGQPAAEQAVGMPVFDYFSKNPDLSGTFNDAMTMFSAVVVPAALDAYDFSGIGTLVDVAGGHGEVLTTILRAYPSMQGVLVDLEHVVAGAVPRIRSMGLDQRCKTVVGDFFQGVPEGGDAYIMKHIIHDWDDEQAGVILRNIRKAAAPGARVILLESVIAEGNAPDFGKIIDFEMLLMPGGRERTAEEFRALFSSAGFEVTRIVPTQSPLSVIEARPV
jgi:hypothetical protein